MIIIQSNHRGKIEENEIMHKYLDFDKELKKAVKYE